MADDTEGETKADGGSFGWPAAFTTMFALLCLLVCTGGARGWLPWQ